nr:TetR/AcrR family transcriptional regulator [Sporomusaceae bacterium]
KALLELLKVKSIYDISIPELAEAADISRATFYLHYKTPYELLVQLEKKLLDNIILEYKNHDILDQYDFLLSLYKFLADNSELLTILMNPNTGSSFWERISGAVKEEYGLLWAQQLEYLTEQERHYCGAFIIDGYISVLKTWLRGGMKETPAQMVELSRRFQYRIIPPE